MRRAPLDTLAAALLVVLAALTVVGTAAAPARAAARVEVSNDRGGSQADVQYRTALTIRGDGFQTIRGGFGGVYVMFGWVRDPQGGSWRPSRGGLTGEDYRYIPDAEDASANQGYLRFIAFPGSSTASEANGVLSAGGSFQVDLTVPGPVFQSVDRSGEVSEVDCRQVTCGVITIGAHGVANAANESFTPVRFGNVYDQAPGDQPAPETTPDAPASTPEAPAVPVPNPGVTDQPGTVDPGTGGGAAEDDTAAPGSTAPPAGTSGPGSRVPATTAPATTTAVLSVDRATAIAGHAMVFSARGFTAGEQVVAVLDDGVAALGPVTSGPSGEVAGILQLPVDLGVGTHELRLTGAASGVEVLERFPVASGDAASTTSDPTATAAGASGDAGDGGGGTTAATVFLLVAVAVLLLALAGLVVTLLRRRRRRGPGTSPTAPAGTGVVA